MSDFVYLQNWLQNDSKEVGNYLKRLQKVQQDLDFGVFMLCSRKTSEENFSNPNIQKEIEKGLQVVKESILEGEKLKRVLLFCSKYLDEYKAYLNFGNQLKLFSFQGSTDKEKLNFSQNFFLFN